MKTPVTIGFRLARSHASDLVARAERFGISPHELSRNLVIAALREKDEIATLREIVVSLHKELTLLREDLAGITAVLLVGAGRASEAQAREWIETNLKRTV